MLIALLQSFVYGRRSVWDGPWVDYPDSWLHLGISAVVATLVYSYCRSRGYGRGSATWMAFGLALALGLGREVYNLWQSRTLPWMFFSMKDMTWNAGGALLGVWLAWWDDRVSGRGGSAAGQPRRAVRRR